MNRAPHLVAVCLFVGLSACPANKHETVQYRFPCPRFAPISADKKIEGTIESSGSGVIFRSKSGRVFSVNKNAAAYLLGGPAAPTGGESIACQTTHKQSLSLLQAGTLVVAGITNDRVKWAVASIP